LSSLEALWWGALAIAGAALLIMVGLILARLVLGWTGHARAAERRRLIPILLGSRPPTRLGRSARGDLLAELSIELIQLVRGSDRARFVDAATRMGVPERLRRQLDSGSTRIRLTAAEALAEFPDEASVEHLTAALSDGNADVRLMAALSLASAGRAPQARALVDRLGIGSRENSLLIVSLFREIAAAKPSEIRSLILDPSVPSGAKAAAIEALSASGDYSLVPLVTTLAVTCDGADESLPRYLSALGDFAHPAAEPAMKRGLGSPFWEVRAAAAEAAGRIGLVRLAVQLRELLGDREWWVRFRAGEALARMGEEGAALLRSSAGGIAEPARTAAALTMAERGVA
jgi:HEAT repeat protein